MPKNVLLSAGPACAFSGNTTANIAAKAGAVAWGRMAHLNSRRVIRFHLQRLVCRSGQKRNSPLFSASPLRQPIGTDLRSIIHPDQKSIQSAAIPLYA
jgi:hypothetical protein